MDQLALFNIAIMLDLDNLLSFCSSSDRINRLICQQDAIWLFKLKKEFPDYKSHIIDNNPRKVYELLTKLKTELKYEENIYQLYNKFIHSHKIFVEGPVEYYDIDVSGKRILLLGDDHFIGYNRKTENLCGDNVLGKKIGIVNFLRSLAITNVQTDFFFELNFPAKTEIEDRRRDSQFGLAFIGSDVRELDLQDYLTEVNRAFFNCLQPNKDDCEYPNVRFHWADIRSFLSTGTEEFLLKYIKSKTVDLEKLKILVNNLNIERMLKESKINKQLSKILPNTAEQIRSYFILQMEQNLKSILDDYGKGVFSNRFLKKIILFEALFFDMYIVSRIFKNLTVPMTRIVVYAGFEHIRNIAVSLLKFPGSTLLSSKINDIKKVKSQCLEITLVHPFNPT